MLNVLAIAKIKQTIYSQQAVYIGPTHSQSEFAIAIVITWELASHSNQQVLVKAKGYTFLRNW